MTKPNFLTKLHATSVIYRLTLQTMPDGLETQFKPSDTTDAFETKGLKKILWVSRTAKKTNEWVFTARCYASAVLAMALCLSVCLSVTSRCSTKTAKRRITQTTPHDRDSSFLKPKISAKFDRGHPLRGRQMQVGWVKIVDFRQITGYISETVQDRRMVSIKVE